MNYNNFDKLAPWVESIRFDEQKRRWIAHFLPGAIVESRKFENIANSLADHVMNEIAMLVAEALNVSTDEMRQKRGKQEVTDAKQVAAIIIVKKMNGLRSYRAIGRSLGWRNHSMVCHSLKNFSTLEIMKKVRRVESRYPILNNGLNRI